MGLIRKPFQGIWNVVRFNWHFYLISCALILFFVLFVNSINEPFLALGKVVCVLVLTIITLSLLVSFYVYDLSDLYKLKWLDKLNIKGNARIINIHAGFDETSVLIKGKFPDSELIVLDFFNPIEHTEISIRRARKVYPPYPNTEVVKTSRIPLEDNFADEIFLTLAAHEIRNDDERSIFFKELGRVLKVSGRIIVTEHLRNAPNFMAYNIGFFHFVSRSSWLANFRHADLNVSSEFRVTPFITTFVLVKNGITS